MTLKPVTRLFHSLTHKNVTPAQEETTSEKRPFPVVTLLTSKGKIILKLFPEVAPMACENFSKLIKSGYYDGTIFHRVIENFMLQGGDPTGTGMGGDSIWKQPFKDECQVQVTFNKPGMLAMANAGPNTNGSQFFITTAPTHWLHLRHTIFGEVIEGEEVMRQLEKVKTDRNDRPLKDQILKKATIEE